MGTWGTGPFDDDGKAWRGWRGPFGWGQPLRVPISAALVARLTFIAEKPRGMSAPALVTGLSFIPELSGRLAREHRTRSRQGQQAAQQERYNFAFHPAVPFVRL